MTRHAGCGTRHIPACFFIFSAIQYFHSQSSFDYFYGHFFDGEKIFNKIQKVMVECSLDFYLGNKC